MAKRSKESVPAEEVVEAEEPVYVEKAVVPVPEPEPPQMSAPEPVATGPSLGQRVRALFNFLARLLLTLIILGLLGIGLYMLLPVLYQNYVLPVQENTTQLEQLRDQQLQSEQAVADLQTRLAELETEQSRQAESFTDLDQRISELETEIAARNESLEALEQMQTTLQSESEALSADLGRQISLLKVMELLSRARLFMYQSNFGLAEQDIRSARDLLLGLQPEAPESLADDLTAVVLRLDLALSNLPDFPVAASDDLDIAWQILLGRLPSAGTLIASATPTAVVTFTLTPAGTSTPTPQTTLTPTATP